MKFAVFTLVPLFAVFLNAQETVRTETHTSTTSTTYNGRLVDAGCGSTQIEESHTTTIGVSRQTQITRTNSVQCPVTSTTSSFGLVTPDGRYIRFNRTSNTRISEIVKNNHSWSKDLRDRKPINVQVVASPNGDEIEMESIR